MKIKIRMYSDYICPFCYLGEAIIEKLKSRFDIEMEHIGIEIHPETPEEGVDLRGRIYGIEEMYENLRCRGKEYGLKCCDAKLLSNSKKALIVGEYARKNSLMRSSKLILNVALILEKKLCFLK